MIKRVTLSEENRQWWMDYAQASDDWPDEEWFDQIKANKPSKITTANFAEYMAVCHLSNLKTFVIHSMAEGATRNQFTWTVSYPPPEQQTLL